MSYDSEDFVTLVERKGGLQRLTPLQEFANFLSDILPSTPGTYSDEDARDAIGTALVAGTGISISINDGADTITITCSITQYTDGMADIRAAAAITTHEAAVNPHPTYLTQAEGDAAYEVIGAVAAHAAAGNPHPVYLTQAEGDGLYSILAHDHDADYEPLGAVASAISTHEAALDPHPGYLTPAEGNAAYASISITQYTDEMVDDRINALFVEGNGIDFSYNDGLNTFTVTVDLSELSTTTLPEGDNLYFTAQRAASASLANSFMFMGA